MPGCPTWPVRSLVGPLCISALAVMLRELMKRCDWRRQEMNIVDLVGDTPLVEVRRVNPNPGVRVLGKVEGNNPSSSVKDRAAKFMIEGAEERGELKPGVRIIEPTSGNTGIALAMIAAVKGFAIELVMPESSTAERVATMEAFGAKG